VPDKQIIPLDGVYASALIYNHMIYPSVTNIGCNPTVGGKSRTIETHVLNAVLDLYGNHVSVLFFERLRDVIRFKSTAELSDQIERDVAEAQNIYRLHEKRVYKFTVL
jgi:riboflavin kinase/FMN adenylyltransferase